jgi:aminoglycoside phosphotransferase (APT) family kinase protein
VELIARGRDADVYALDEKRVLRRYRSPGPTEAEARLMRHVAECGFPVPRVYETTDTDMVLERLSGPTMLVLAAQQPERVEEYGRMLGELHDWLHELAAPPWLARLREVEVEVEGEEDGDARILHLDFHPDNVIMTEAGPVVIDWRTAHAGEPAVDLAMTTVVVKYSDLPEHIAATAFEQDRHRFLSALQAASRADPTPYLAGAIQARLHDWNVTPAEAERLRGAA